MNPFKVLSEVTKLYHILEDGEDSKELISFITSLTECYTDGKIDLDVLVKKLGDKTAPELAAFVKQAQRIIDQAKVISTSVGE
jgi:hypothetical protein